MRSEKYYRELVDSSIKYAYDADASVLTDVVRSVLEREGHRFKTQTRHRVINLGLLPREVRSVSEAFRVKGSDVHIIISKVDARDDIARIQLHIGPVDPKNGDLAVHLYKEIQLAMLAALSRRAEPLPRG